MSGFTTWKHRALSRLVRYWPDLGRYWARQRSFAGGAEIPWAPLRKPLTACRVALVTTAGVHLRTQAPFDMQNPLGDASFRAIPNTATPEQLTITHDYYDHRDADRDINIVFPVERLQELMAQGEIGATAPVHVGFMGHIDGELIPVLQQQTAPAATARLREAEVDVALLFPA